MGTHVLRLYKPPIPEPGELPLSPHPVPRNWIRYGRANVRIHIGRGQPTDDSPPPSDIDTDEEEDCPKVIKGIRQIKSERLRTLQTYFNRQFFVHFQFFQFNWFHKQLQLSLYLFIETYRMYGYQTQGVFHLQNRSPQQTGLIFTLTVVGFFQTPWPYPE